MTDYMRALRNMVTIMTTHPRNRAERRAQSHRRKSVIRYTIRADKRYGREPGKVMDRLIADTNLALAVRGARMRVAVSGHKEAQAAT